MRSDCGARSVCNVELALDGLDVVPDVLLLEPLLGVLVLESVLEGALVDGVVLGAAGVVLGAAGVVLGAAGWVCVDPETAGGVTVGVVGAWVWALAMTTAPTTEAATAEAMRYFITVISIS